MYTFEALMLIAKTEFAPLGDREGFGGVESEDAVMGEFDGGIIIIDGDMAQFVYENGDFDIFKLKG